MENKEYECQKWIIDKAENIFHKLRGHTNVGKTASFISYVYLVFNSVLNVFKYDNNYINIKKNVIYT